MSNSFTKFSSLVLPVIYQSFLSILDIEHIVLLEMLNGIYYVQYKCTISDFMDGFKFSVSHTWAWDISPKAIEDIVMAMLNHPNYDIPVNIPVPPCGLSLRCSLRVFPNYLSECLRYCR